MAKLTMLLDQRASSAVIGGKFPLVLRVSHKGKNRYIPLDIALKPDQFDLETKKITGIRNAVRHTNRVTGKYSDIDNWLIDNKATIALWHVDKIKDDIEKRFFNKQSHLSVLGHSADFFTRLMKENRHSTASSYQDGLKAFIRYKMTLAGKPDRVEVNGHLKTIEIKTLFRHNKEDVKKGGIEWLEILPEYAPYDMPIKAMDVALMKGFKAYLSSRYASVNTVNIHLRSLQSILSDAEGSYDDLKGHKPLEGIKKTSTSNDPVVLTMDEIKSIKALAFDEKDSKFHVRNYFLFMFNNMGMNFYDVALAKVNQFDGERFRYTRKKTEREGDHFSIQQHQENLSIIAYYSHGKKPDDYLFPIIPKDTPSDRIFRVKKDRAKWFNNNLKKIAKIVGIDKNLTTYTARDTWANIGLEMGIDLHKISSGLGHFNTDVTEKHYAQKLNEKILDDINGMITNPSSKNLPKPPSP